MSSEGDDDFSTLELVLKFIAFTNVLMALFGFYFGIIFPYFEFVTVISPSAFTNLLLVYFLDFVSTGLFLYYIRRFIPENRRFTIIFIVYMFVALITRFFVAGIASGRILDNTFIVAQFLIGISSLLFAIMLRTISNQLIVGEFRNSLRIIAGLNILTSFMTVEIVYPVFVSNLTVQLIFMGIFILLGIFKEVSYIYSGITFLRWSESLKEMSSEEKEIEEEEEVDLAWPEARQ